MFSGDWGYIYSNDRDLLIKIDNLHYVTGYYIKEAVVSRTKNTIVRKSSAYRFRSYFAYKKYDENKDLKLDDDEMEALLKEAVGVASVSGDDVKRVRVLFDKYSAGKYSAGHETEGIDPIALAKAISVWDDEANLSEGMFARGFVPMPEQKFPELPDFFGGISNFFNKMCTPVCTTKRPSEREAAVRENTKDVLADLCTPQNNISSVHDGPLFELDGSMSDRTFLKRAVIRNHRLNNS
jgi:hypothetical protein